MTFDGQKQRLFGALALVVLAVALIYTISGPSVPDFSDYPAGKERKQAFFSYFLPLVTSRNQQIADDRDQLLAWHQDASDLGWWDEHQLTGLAEHYGMESFDVDSDSDWSTLLRRVDTVPPSLALAQAANESAWGTSRFSREGYNFYGQWCFEEGCGIVPNKRDAGKNHEVAAFDSPQESVDRYINNLNTHDAYKPLRLIRARLRDQDKSVTGLELAGGLGKYSERGDAYISELRSMMRFNDLGEYDQ